MSLTKKVQLFCQQKNLFSPGDKVIIGVSGGKDSLALCATLLNLRQELGLDLHIAHYNHRLRKDANTDAAFVKELAGKLGLPYYCASAKTNLKLGKGSLEEKAREARLNFLINLARKLNADCVALAHTEDDLAETVLMRILRGGGTKGMMAILPKRKLQGITFVRPLLSLSSKEILRFLKAKKIRYREDASNKQKKYFRNKIRLDLLPLLENNYNTNVKEILATLANNASVDYDYLEKCAQKALQRHRRSQKGPIISLNTENLKREHLSIQRLIMRLAIIELKGDTRKLNFKHLEEVDDLIHSRPMGSIVNLPNRISVKKAPTNIKLYISKS